MRRLRPLPTLWSSIPLTVVMPTYNAAESLPKMAEALMALELSGLGPLVVDDNSPDGAGDVAEALAERFNEPGRPRISVLLRTAKDGLGRAWAMPHSRCGSGVIRW
ncbi:glycosyltransferase [Streptomyces sp. NPDC055092]